jgi:hypothetical protein
VAFAFSDSVRKIGTTLGKTMTLKRDREKEEIVSSWPDGDIRRQTRRYQ